MTPRQQLPEKNYKVVKTAAGQFSQIDPVFSSDSRYIFVGTGSTVKVLKIITCAVVRSLEHQNSVTAFMLNPRNKLQLMVACGKNIYVWDWQDGVLLKTVKMPRPITHMFSVSKTTGPVYYVVLEHENNNGRSFYKCDLDFNESNTHHLFDTSKFECLTYASDGSFFVTAHGYDITVTFENGSSETYTTPGKKATSLHINLRDDVVAAGCNNGEIRLIPCANGKLDMAAVASHHWHKNPVPAIRFLGDGVTLLSGGEETVLVFWNTLFQRRHFVPRVGGPIKSIVASPNHALYALLLGNNLIQLINSTTRDIQYSIQGLQTPTVHKPKCLMAHEPRNKHLAFRSAPGTIQFYDYSLDKHNSTLEVAPQNHKVHHIAFSRDGRWMATVDTLEKESSGSLKFWDWNEDTQAYKLHTSILNFEVSKRGSLLFNNARGNDGLMAITISGGKTFKVWMLEEAAEKGFVWKCRSENSFRNHSPTAAAFSADDSIVAVSFDRLITLWDIVENKVMDALVQPSGYQVQKLHFLADSPFMLSVTDHEFAVWNILTMDVWYSYNVPCQFVAVDRYSSRFAVIARLFNTSAKQLIVFTPDSSIPESCTPLTSSILGMEFEKDVLLVTDDYSILQLSATTPEVTSQEERAKISNEAPESGIFDSIFGRRQQEAREAAEQASKTEKVRQGEANVQEALALLAGPSQSLPGVSDIFESIMTSLMELRVVDNTVDGQVQAADVTMEESSENKEEIVDVTLDPNFKLDTFSDLKFPSLVDKASISKAKAEESSSSSEESEEEEDPSDIAW